jgi:hypothetical protein
MRVQNWNPNAYDQIFEDVCIERLVKAAETVASNVRQRCPVGTESRPMYKTGPYAGQPWTARDAGQLRDSIRVVQKKSKYGKPLVSKRNVRVYAGHYLAYYASIVEFASPFMRPSFQASIPAIKAITGAR